MKNKDEVRRGGELRSRRRGEMRMNREPQREDTERLKTFVIDGFLVKARSRKEAEQIFCELTGEEIDNEDD